MYKTISKGGKENILYIFNVAFSHLKIANSLKNKTYLSCLKQDLYHFNLHMNLT